MSSRLFSHNFFRFPINDLVQADISKQKAALQKHSVIVKTQQKEQQTAALELGASCFGCCVVQRLTQLQNKWKPISRLPRLQ